MKHILKSILVVLIISLHITTKSEARQFRILNPIATGQKFNMPSNAIPVQTVQPVQRSVVEPMVRDILSKWNTEEMTQTLGEEFYDASRLTDTLNTVAQRDATLRLQSIQGIQTQQQYIIANPNGSQGAMVSVVSVLVKAQLEFNSPTDGFVRRQGTNELVFKVVTAAPP